VTVETQLAQDHPEATAALVRLLNRPGFPGGPIR
jgi:hypothetical protein